MALFANGPHAALRLFVFGLEVTDDVGGYTTSWTDGRSPSTLSFQLANVDDRYQTTRSDLQALYDDVGVAADADPIAAIAANLDQRIGDSSKRAVLRTKFPHFVPDVIAQGVNDTGRAGQRGTLGTLLQQRGEAHRYPFYEGESIFHTNDPITLFERDPFTGQWFWGFSGLGTAFNFDEDARGRSVLNVTAEGPLRLFRYARITFDPGILDYQFVKTAYDAEIRSWDKQALADLTLPEAVYLVTFGNSILVPGPNQPQGQAGPVRLPENKRVSINGFTTVAKQPDGVGSFDFVRSEILEIGPESSVVGPPRPLKIQGKTFRAISNLGQWQASMDHAVVPSDLETRFVDPTGHATELNQFIHQAQQQFRTPGAGVRTEWDIDEVISIIGSNPHLYPVDAGRLMMLVPRSLGAATNRDLLLKDLLQGPALTTSFSTRLKIILDLVERLEFSFYETPRGDLVVEMPLYDFRPEDFGDQPVVVETPPTVGEFGDQERGPFTPRYQFALEDTTSLSSSFNDERIRTQMIVPYFLLDQELAGTSKDVLKDFGAVLLDHLVPQFGVRSEEIPPQAFIRSKEAATIYGHIKLNLWNADARSSQAGVIPRLGVGPNRPLWVEKRNQIGTGRVIQRSLQWMKSYSMNLALNYVRRFSGQTDEFGRDIYEPVGGFGGRPLNYALLFANQTSLPPLRVRASPPDAPLGAPSLAAASTIARKGHLRWLVARSTTFTDPNMEAAVSAVERYIDEVIKPVSEAAGFNVTVNSTYRTPENQAKLNAQFPNDALAPNRSDHPKGLAVDLGPSSIADALWQLIRVDVPAGERQYINQSRSGPHREGVHRHVHLSFYDSIIRRKSIG